MVGVVEQCVGCDSAGLTQHLSVVFSFSSFVSFSAHSCCRRSRVRLPGPQVRLPGSRPQRRSQSVPRPEHAGQPRLHQPQRAQHPGQRHHQRSAAGVQHRAQVRLCQCLFCFSFPSNPALRSIISLAITGAQSVAGIFPNGVLAALDVLNATHNVIEHDASLSRSDYNLGDWVRPNGTLISQFLPNLGFGTFFLNVYFLRLFSAILTRSDIAAARKRRIQDSQARNPSFTFGATAQAPVAAGEVWFYFFSFLFVSICSELTWRVCSRRFCTPSLAPTDRFPPSIWISFYARKCCPRRWAGTAAPRKSHFLVCLFFLVRSRVARREIGQLTFLPLVAYYTVEEVSARNPHLSVEEATLIAKQLVAKGRWAHF
jgi:hypothetical protein